MGRRTSRAFDRANRVLLVLLAVTVGVAHGEDTLARAERLRDEGRNDEALVAAREVLASDASDDVKARAQYLVAFVLDFRKNDRGAALDAYREFLARWKHPRLTEVARARVAELERMLAGPDADLLRAMEDLSRSFATLDPVGAIRSFRYDLQRRGDSPVVARGWELLGDLQTDERVKDWDGAIESYRRAEGIEPDAWQSQLAGRRREDLGHKIGRATIERRRVRLYHAGVAVLALVVSATAMLLTRRGGRLRASHVLATLLPWGLLTGAFWALQHLEAREDPENPMTTGRIALFAALSLVPVSCSALLSRSLGRSGRIWVPLASLLAMLGLIAVFCHHFDYFHLFGL